MHLLSDVITYIRRIIKSPSNTSITDNLLIDYINRFWISDVDARMQLFDLKMKYQFQTSPGVDQYNMPLYSLQTEPGAQSINYYPVYQGFQSPIYINGIECPFYTQKHNFFNIWPNITQQMQVIGTGNGTTGPYNLTFTISPSNTQPLNPPFEYVLRGHIDISGIIAFAGSPGGSLQDPPLITSTQVNDIGLNPAGNFIQNVPTMNVFPAVYITSTAADGSNIIVTDSGQFLFGNQNYGILMQQGNAPNGNLPLTNGPTPFYSTTQNTINYFTGIIKNLYFPQAIPLGANISAQCYFFQTGLPRGVLFNNNTLTFRSPPDKQYLVELDAYLTPAAFLSTSSAVQFGYMSEYIARGAARKILSDTGDIEQFQFYEPLFREQELLVWKRSQRQFTSTRTQTIYSQGLQGGQVGNTSLGGAIN